MLLGWRPRLFTGRRSIACCPSAVARISFAMKTRAMLPRQTARGQGHERELRTVGFPAGSPASGVGSTNATKGGSPRRPSRLAPVVVPAPNHAESSEEKSTKHAARRREAPGRRSFRRARRATPEPRIFWHRRRRRRGQGGQGCDAGVERAHEEPRGADGGGRADGPGEPPRVPAREPRPLRACPRRRPARPRARSLARGSRASTSSSRPAPEVMIEDDIVRYAARFASARPTPNDIVYVHDFDHPEAPRPLVLPPGHGADARRGDGRRSSSA